MRILCMGVAVMLSLNLFCSRPKQKISPVNGLSVFVSIAPQKYFVEKIGGAQVTVSTLIPPGASPHTFEPKPAQMIALAEADCYFTVGLTLEKKWVKRIRELNPALVIIATDSGSTLLAEEDHESGGHNKTHPSHNVVHHHHSAACGHDPHIWLAPSLVKKQIRIITTALSRSDTAHTVEFKQRHEQFSREIDSLSATIHTRLASCGIPRSFLVFHPSWGYFAREFSLQQIAVESDGGEPTLRELSTVVATAKEHGIKTILIQPQFSKKTARLIAGHIGAEVAEADPMAEDWADNLYAVVDRICR